VTERLFDPGRPPPATARCPLCGTAQVRLRADGRTLARHTFSARLVVGGAVTWLCGVACEGGGMTVAAARALAEQPSGAG
jgi:hypothetical protein